MEPVRSDSALLSILLLPSVSFLLLLLVSLSLHFGQVRAQELSQVTDINPGSGGSYPSYVTPFQDELLFRANGTVGTSDAELWRYDGVEAALAAEIYPGTAGSSPAYLTVYGDLLYFTASGPTGPPRLWRFDGTTASLAPGSEAQGQNPEGLIAFHGRLYYRAWRSNIGMELWWTDGTQQVPIDTFPGSGSSYPQHFIEYQGSLYFNANASPGQGSELCRLNEATMSVIQVTNINSGGASPESPVVFGGMLYFSAYEPVHGRELWRFDGVTAVRMTDIVPGFVSSNPSGMIAYRDAIYFAADDEIHGNELWRFDGTTAELVADVNPKPIEPYVDPVHHSWPGDFFVFADVLYFAADDGTHGRELWSYDGVEARLVADIYPGVYGSNVSEFAEYQGSLFFSADDGVGGGELGESSFALWRLLPEPPVSFLRGDCNGDGEVSGSVSDAVTVLIFNFLGGPEPPCLAACDADGDGSVRGTIGDAVYLLSYAFLDGPPPPPPSEACGPQTPTDELLGCAATPLGCE